MPTYQYACTACGHQLEAVQSFSDAPLSQCPACDGRLRKLFSTVGVVFKGSGFYRTDSRAATKNGSNGSGKGAAKESTTSGASTSASGNGSSSNGSSSSDSSKAATKPAASAA